MSDEKYALELQLQEALMSSAICSTTGSINLQTYQHFNSRKTLNGKEKEESSNSQTDNGSLCLICLDVKPVEEMFRSNTCSHLFCKDCIGKYVASKIQENIAKVKCPDINYKVALEPQFCHSIVPGEVFDRWENALCESLILGLLKFYCPFQCCSAMLVAEGSDAGESECPNCHRLFCAQCKVAWHAGISCSEFRNLSKDERPREDIMVMELARTISGEDVQTVRYYAEKIEGC